MIYHVRIRNLVISHFRTHCSSPDPVFYKIYLVPFPAGPKVTLQYSSDDNITTDFNDIWEFVVLEQVDCPMMASDCELAGCCYDIKTSVCYDSKKSYDYNVNFESRDVDLVRSLIIHQPELTCQSGESNQYICHENIKTELLDISEKAEELTDYFVYKTKTQGPINVGNLIEICLSQNTICCDIDLQNSTARGTNDCESDFSTIMLVRNVWGGFTDMTQVSPILTEFELNNIEEQSQVDTTIDFWSPHVYRQTINTTEFEPSYDQGPSIQEPPGSLENWRAFWPLDTIRLKDSSDTDVDFVPSQVSDFHVHCDGLTCERMNFYITMNTGKSYHLQTQKDGTLISDEFFREINFGNTEFSQFDTSFTFYESTASSVQVGIITDYKMDNNGRVSRRTVKLDFGGEWLVTISSEDFSPSRRLQSQSETVVFMNRYFVYKVEFLVGIFEEEILAVNLAQKSIQKIRLPENGGPVVRLDSTGHLWVMNTENYAKNWFLRSSETLEICERPGFVLNQNTLECEKLVEEKTVVEECATINPLDIDFLGLEDDQWSFFVSGPKQQILFGEDPPRYRDIFKTWLNTNSILMRIISFK